MGHDHPTYLIIFPAAIVVRRKFPDTPRPFLVPGGDRGMLISTVLATFFAALGSWVAVFPGTLEQLFGLEYNFVEEWEVSRGRFEALTLGTVAVIVLLTVIGMAIGRAERRRESEDAAAARLGGVEALPEEAA